MLKKVFLMAVVLAGSSLVTDSADAGDIWVRSHVRSNGTYVKPHYRSRPDGNFYNNYSSYPNINPYTGRTGIRRTPSYSSYPTFRARSYSSPSYRTRSYSFSSPSLSSFGLGSYSSRRSRIRGW